MSSALVFLMGMQTDDLEVTVTATAGSAGDTGACPDDEEIAAFLEGRIGLQAGQELERHVDRCRDCARLMADLGRDQGGTISVQLRREASSELNPGDYLGRYICLGQVGRGGMGVVYSGYDPELDRRVALKVLLGSQSTQSVRARLLREAQSMARLAHPNVATVHDVGLADGRVFVAMEFVDGPTLQQWLMDERAWTEVLSVFLQAGEGLRAAHDANLVHRDFKPGNAMIGADGRVRVLDFGLAKLAEDAAVTVSSPSDPSADVEAPTMTQGLVGTPAYMAPEQHSGLPADARSDQFAFCVALWEALYGVRPFAGKTVTQLAVSVLEGEIQEPPSQRGVPAWVRQPLLRGLSVEPAERFPTMAELLAVLRHDPDRRRRKQRRGLAMGGALLAAVAGGSFLSMGTRDLCRGSEERMSEVWSPAASELVERAFEDTGLAGATASAERVSAAIDEYAQAWTEAHREACEATRVRQERSVELLDREMGCLDRSRRELRAAIRVLQRPDATLVENAVDVVTQLPDPDTCLDPAKVASRFEPPPPDANDAVEQVRDSLGEAVALRRSGSFEAAASRASTLVERAEEIGYRPLIAEVKLELGTSQSALAQTELAIRNLEDAFFAARELTDHGLTTRAATELVDATGTQDGDWDEAQLWARLAEVELGLWDAPTGQARGHFESRLGQLASHAGEAEAAVEHYQTALWQFEEVGAMADAASARAGVGRELMRLDRHDEAIAALESAIESDVSTLGPEHPRVGRGRVHLAKIFMDRGEVEKATELAESAYRILAAGLGERHPATADALSQLGGCFLVAGEVERAIELRREALEIVREARGPMHQQVAVAHNNLAQALDAAHRYEEAIQEFERALEIKQELYGDVHESVAVAHNNLGNALASLGRHDEAFPELERALQIWRMTLGESHSRYGAALNNLGHAYAEIGRPLQARPHLEQAVGVFERALGPEHPLVAYPLNTLATVLMDLGQPEAARDRAARAVKLREAAQVEPVELASSYFTYAYAIYESGGERDEWREYALEARDIYANAEADRSEAVAKIDALLRRQ